MYTGELEIADLSVEHRIIHHESLGMNILSLIITDFSVHVALAVEILRVLHPNARTDAAIWFHFSSSFQVLRPVIPSLSRPSPSFAVDTN